MTLFTEGTVDQLKESAPLFVQKKAIILIKSPYVSLSNLSAFLTSLTLPSKRNNWSESIYNDLVRGVRAALQNIGISAERYIYCNFQDTRKLLIQYSTPVVPTDLQGENFIEPSPEFPWYTETTLVNALDNVF
jgi:hypothetical protein